MRRTARIADTIFLRLRVLKEAIFACLLLLLLSGRAESRLSGARPRIVGGQPAKDPYPFFIEWHEGGCGGSLIHEDIMLSAAHCFGDSNPFRRVVYIGGNEKGEGAVARTITKQIPHPRFNDSLYSDLKHDIMVMKLNASALRDEYGNPTDGVEIIPYNTDRFRPEKGEPLMVMGYGLESATAYWSPKKLREVVVPAWSDEDCVDAYRATPFPIDPELMICAGSDGLDSCQGDSGGPIIDKKQVQVGIVSYGESCGGEEFPGVYTRVSFFAEWIHDTICQWSCFPPAADCDPGIVNECIQPGNINMTLQVNLDLFPRENALLVEHVDSATELLHRPYSSLIEPGEMNFTFTNMPNGTYRVVIGDSNRDGICCEYGRGNLTLINDHTGASLLFVPGDFGSFASTNVSLQEGSGGETLDNGTAVVDVHDSEGSANGTFAGSAENDEEENVGFLETEEYQYIIDTGKLQYPDVGSTNNITLNIQYDENMQQQEWAWGKKNLGAVEEYDEKWEKLGSGHPFAFRQFVAHPLDVPENNTLYRLLFTDDNEDGMSNETWVVLTNGTATESNPQGTIMWVLRGSDFKGAAEAFIWVDDLGNAQAIRKHEAEEMIFLSSSGLEPESEAEVNVSNIPVVSSHQSGFEITGHRVQSHYAGYDDLDP